MQQQDDIDYQETFSPLIKSVTIRLILSSALVTKNWEFRQLDVSNTFLHGILEETMFM